MPSLAVITTAFESAAEVMRDVLGANGMPFSVIEHPISSATGAELAEQAAAVAQECARYLVIAD